MKPRTFFLLVGWTGLVACSVTMLLTFYTAYFNDFQVTVYINKLGEAVPELLILTFMMPFMVYAAKDYLDIVVMRE